MSTQVIQLSESTQTAKEAASALSCALGQIVKSLVFRVNDDPILVLTSGSNHVDERLISRTIGARWEQPHVIMLAQVTIGSVQFGIITMGLAHGRLQVITDNDLRDPTKKRQCSLMGVDPTGKLLIAAGLHVRKI